MRGTPTRAPYWPQASRPIDLPPSRRSLVSWSLSNESATAQRAPPGHSAGRNGLPARTLSTSLRQCASGHCQGSRGDSGRSLIVSLPKRRSGRSGEIRTLDPQHPMLMRYQAALRSDRASLARRRIILAAPTARNASAFLAGEQRVEHLAGGEEIMHRRLERRLAGVGKSGGNRRGFGRGAARTLSLIHISEPTRQAEISYAVFC